MSRPICCGLFISSRFSFPPDLFESNIRIKKEAARLRASSVSLQNLKDGGRTCPYLTMIRVLEADSKYISLPRATQVLCLLTL
jgi:hypothetical protein